MRPTLAFLLAIGALVATPAAASPPGGLHPAAVAAPPAEGPPKEVTVVADLPTVKIVAITLRAGTKLPEHTAPVPVTLQAAHGAATLTVGDRSTLLSAERFAVLDAEVPHAVVPVGPDPVTVLVHHHKR